jgi:uncharacterized protein YdaU (DUF1376 family)
MVIMGRGIHHSRPRLTTIESLRVATECVAPSLFLCPLSGEGAFLFPSKAARLLKVWAMNNNPDMASADDDLRLIWFPVRIGDETMESKDFSLETRGALYTLALHYFYHGGLYHGGMKAGRYHHDLPPDERLVQKIARVPPRKWPAVSAELKTIFTPDWRHPRWDRILDEQRAKLAKKRKASEAGVEARRRHATPVSLQERRAASASASAAAYYEPEPSYEPEPPYEPEPSYADSPPSEGQSDEGVGDWL